MSGNIEVYNNEYYDNVTINDLLFGNEHKVIIKTTYDLNDNKGNKEKETLKTVNIPNYTDEQGVVYKAIDTQNAIVTRFSGNEVDIVIPEVVKGYTVNKINNMSFENSNIEKIDIPVQAIEHLAMKTGVLDIDPASVTSVNGIAIVALDIDDKHEALANTVFNKAKGIDTFCLPNK